MLNVYELAERTGATQRQLRYWLSKGLIGGVEVDGRIRFEPGDVDWACAIARLIRAGVSPEYLATMTEIGMMAPAIEELVRASKGVRKALDQRSAAMAS